MPGATPAVTLEAPAHAEGFVTDIDALTLGVAAVALGAGRRVKEDAVDPAAGFVLLKKPGEPVRSGEPLVTVSATDPGRLDRAAVLGAFAFGPEPPAPAPVLLDRYDGRAWRRG